MLVLTAGLAFSAGAWFGRGAPERALKRARHRLGDLVRVVQRTLDSAQEACDLLGKFPKLLLSLEQLERLDRRQSQLLNTIGEIVTRQRERAAATLPAMLAATEELSAARPGVPFSVTWVRTPEDPETELPDASAFETNLAAMLEAAGQSGTPCGVLLVKVDRLEHLRTRCGWTGARQFIRRIARICTQAARDADLICRSGDDTLGLLMPAVEPSAGYRLAEEIRAAVRGHRFRIDETGAEVLVTASFGYASCGGGDDVHLVLSRAGDAIARSQERGRNQLHVHDGASARLCATS